MIRKLLLGAVAVAASAAANATVILSEGFDNVAGLAGAGWTLTNNSAPVGSTDWFQGNTGVFDAQSGAADSYIAANYLNADLGGAISNWLISPTLELANHHFLTFFTRSGGFFSDSLEVRFSTNGASTLLGDFSNLALTINPLLDGNYPTDWTAYTVQFAGVASGTLGRFAFHYTVPDTFDYGDYIGIDSVRVFVPEPSALALFAASLLGFAWVRRRRSI